MIIIGLDGATWKVILPNIDILPTFRRLLKENKFDTIKIRKHTQLPQKTWLHSAPLWTSIFSGVEPERHRHLNFFADDGYLLKRKDIPVRFAWDVIADYGFECVALNIPFVYPPYSYGTNFKASTLGIALNEDEWIREMNELTKACYNIIDKKSPDLFVVVFTVLDHVQHLYWGETKVLKWYQKIDEVLDSLLYEENWIILSDHGFCAWDDTPIRTTYPRGYKGTLKKGDHDIDAILITNGVDFLIKQPEDVCYAMLHNFKIPQIDSYIPRSPISIHHRFWMFKRGIKKQIKKAIY